MKEMTPLLTTPLDLATTNPTTFKNRQISEASGAMNGRHLCQTATKFLQKFQVSLSWIPLLFESQLFPGMIEKCRGHRKPDQCHRHTGTRCFCPPWWRFISSYVFAWEMFKATGQSHKGRNCTHLCSSTTLGLRARWQLPLLWLEFICLKLVRVISIHQVSTSISQCKWVS